MGDRVVEYRARRETEIQRALAFLRPLAGNDSGRRIQRFGCCRQQLGKLAVLLGRIGGSRLQEFGHAELAMAVRALAPRRRYLAYLWRGVIEHLREFDAGLTVDPAVMSLGIKGDQSAFQAIDDVHLPQRTTAVEQRGVQARDELFELGHGAWPAQSDGANVIVEVDVVVLDPDRLSQLERHLRQLAVQKRRQVEALAKQRFDGLVVIARVTLRQLKEHEAADMHRRLRRFEVQE